MLNFLDIHKQMLPNSISMIFKGAVTFELIDSIIMVISNRLEQIEENIKTRKKVFGVLMECLQNLGNHVEDFNAPNEVKAVDEYDPSSVLFMIDSINGGYRILTANFIPTSKVEGLKIWIEEINSLSPEAQRKKYNEILQNNEFSSKGGGGLGFLDIALKVGEKMEYNFQYVNEEFSFFTFQTNIKKA